MTIAAISGIAAKAFGFVKAAATAIKVGAIAFGKALLTITAPQAVVIGVCAGAVVGTTVLVVKAIKHMAKSADKSENVTENILRKGQEKRSKKKPISKILKEIEEEMNGVSAEYDFDEKDMELLRGRKGGRFHEFFMKNKSKGEDLHEDWFYEESPEEKKRWEKELKAFKKKGYIL